MCIWNGYHFGETWIRNYYGIPLHVHYGTELNHRYLQMILPFSVLFQVDAIDHYTQEEAQYKEKYEQEKINAYQDKLGIAFVTFEDDQVAARWVETGQLTAANGILKWKQLESTPASANAFS